MTPQRLAVAVLVLAAFLQCYLASRVKSVTRDVPFHIVSGVSYLETGDIAANQQHPPLLKELSAVFLWAAGVRLPAIASAYALTDDAPVANVVGTALLDQYGPERTMFWGRLPFLLMTAGFVVVLYLLGCRLVGRAAALGGTFLFAFDPIVLGHAHYVTTDVGFAFCTTLLMLALWDYLQRPTWPRALACGLALGLVLGAKFSAVVLLPVIPVLALAAALWPASQVGSTHDGRLWPLRVSWPRLQRHAGGIALMALIAVALLQWIYLFPDLGVRYVIPVLPFAHLLGGVALAPMFQADRLWKQASGLVVCAWVGIAAAGIPGRARGHQARPVRGVQRDPVARPVVRRSVAADHATDRAGRACVLHLRDRRPRALTAGRNQRGVGNSASP